ncbi:MAG: MFS transporter [Actinomycetota bacterium]|nr:MFS transporter [Actinomycetota bacterium]
MKRAPAEPLYYALELLLSTPTWVVMSIYLVAELDLSPLQLVLMGTAMEATVFLFEVPTGVLADTYSRRLSLTIGFLGMGVAWLLVGVVSAPAAIVALWAAWGISYTFTSGAYQAWITDEVGVDRVGVVFLRGARFAYVGALLGLIGFVALGTVSLRAAVVASGAVTVAGGLACLLLMPETGFGRRPKEERAGALAELRTTAVNGGRFVRAQPVLILLIGIALVGGMSSEAFDRLKEAHFIRDVGLPAIGGFDAVVWFGAFSAVAMVFGFFVLGRLQKRFERVGSAGLAKLLLAFTAVMIGGLLCYALTGSAAVAIVALLAVLLTRGVVYPLWETWVNEQITDSSVRATVISITGQADAIGQTAGGPVLGAIGNVWGIRAALTTGALVLLPALGLYGRAIAHGGKEPELEELPDPVEA